MNDIINVTDFLNTRYRDYSMYVLYSRAIPSLIDGLKPSQRKIIYTANKVCKTSLIKCASLAGDVISKGNYHHGNASLEDAIDGMVQDFKNNIPWLKGKGTFGSRLVPTAAAARYTFTKMSPDFYNYFTDFEICEPTGDPEDPEPRFYLPIIPTILLNGSNGIAVGFRCLIQPRNPKQLAELCKMVAEGQDISNIPIPPYFEGFKGQVKYDDVNSVYKMYGVVSRTAKKNVVKVTEVPVGIDREKYVNTLHKLEDKGVIRSFNDRCSKVGFDFEVRLVNTHKSYSDDELLELLNLVVNCNETLTVIDQHGNVKPYNKVNDMIVDFCHYRMSKYHDRYAYWYDRDKERKRLVDVRIQFIKAVLAGKIDMKNTTKSELKLKLQKTKLGDDIIESLLRMPMHSMCQDGLDDLIEKSDKFKADMETWSTVVPENEYIKELETIYKMVK